MLRVIDGRDQLTPVHISRPTSGDASGDPVERANRVVSEVRLRGDAAAAEHTAAITGRPVDTGALRVPERVIGSARSLVPPDVIDAFEVLQERLRSTCERQLPRTWIDEEADETIGELVRPIWRVGIYVPDAAGSASSVLMAATPARLAGVEGLVVCAPPRSDGEIAPATLAACAVAGIDEIYRISGPAAIASLAYGTESVRGVQKIVGGGDRDVLLAKKIVATDVGIDSGGGPSEVALIADATARPEVVTADLIAQAESGPHGTQAVITWVPDLVSTVSKLLEVEMARHERAEDLENALIEGGVAVLVRDVQHALDTANAFAPQHLQLDFEGAWEAVDRVSSAGSIFVGPHATAANYVSGINSILPSGGSARWASGLRVSDFVKRIYVSSQTPSSLERLSPHVDALSEAEEMFAQARALWVRERRTGMF